MLIYLAGVLIGYFLGRRSVTEHEYNQRICGGNKKTYKIVCSQKQLASIVWSLDYHWHGITKHDKGNTTDEAQVDYLRQTLRDLLEWGKTK